MLGSGHFALGKEMAAVKACKKNNSPIFLLNQDLGSKDAVSVESQLSGPPHNMGLLTLKELKPV